MAIVGVGYTRFASISPDLSYKEIVFEAATRAYEDAGVDPRRDIESFVSVSEDFQEGTSIFDEYVPDQMGAALKPVQTIAGDGIHGLATAYMLILSGIADIVAVEGHSKASNVLNPNHVLNYALDPVYNRPLGLNPYYIAGMEMNRYLHETGTKPEQCALVVEKNKRNALDNPVAGHGANVKAGDVLASETMFAPLRRLEVSPSSDGAIVMVLASEERAGALRSLPVWIRGVGWCTDTPGLEERDWGKAGYARLAGDMAYRMADIRSPRREIDLAEVDDTFSYKELQHMEALRLCRTGEAGLLVEEGATRIGGDLPVNSSGGSLGVGHLGDASGLHRVLEVILQLRGAAGKRQLKGVQTGLAQSWRGVAAASGAVIILTSKER